MIMGLFGMMLAEIVGDSVQIGPNSSNAAPHTTRQRRHGPKSYIRTPPTASLEWVSRQFDTSEVIIIFGDRVGPEPLIEKGDSRPQCNALGGGRDNSR